MGSLSSVRAHVAIEQGRAVEALAAKVAGKHLLLTLSTCLGGTVQLFKAALYFLAVVVVVDEIFCTFGARRSLQGTGGGGNGNGDGTGGDDGQVLLHLTFLTTGRDARVH